MRILDASVLVAAYIEKDLHHAKAKELLESIPQDERILLNDYLVNEIVTVMLRKYGLQKAKDILEYLTSNSKIAIQHTSEEDFQLIVRRFQKQTSALSFVDCSVLCLSDSGGCKIETFDKALENEIRKRGAA